MALVDPVIDVFSVQEKNIIDQVITELGNKNATQISEYAHGDAPWILTQDKQPIEYPLVELRRAPYAQTESLASWVDVGAADVLKYLGPMDPEEAEYYRNL